MKRISKTDLSLAVYRLNQVTKNHYVPWLYSLTEKRAVAQVGNYHLDYANGGCALHQMVNDMGASRDPLFTGYVTKKELYACIIAYIRGFQDAREGRSDEDDD